MYCVAQEAISQNVTVPYNTKEVRFRVMIEALEGEGASSRRTPLDPGSGRGPSLE